MIYNKMINSKKIFLIPVGIFLSSLYNISKIDKKKIKEDIIPYLIVH